jgi:hypothetical protein
MDKDPAQQLTPRQHIDRFTALHHIQMQRGALQFLYWAYGFLLVTTMLIILFQGFRVGGFALDASFLKWLVQSLWVRSAVWPLRSMARSSVANK